MLLNLYRKCKTNVGDNYTSPLKYFDLGPAKTEDVWGITTEQLDFENIILGGGGLTIFNKDMDLLSHHASKIIAWGMGCNEVQVHYRKPTYPSWLSNCKLIGVRDWGTPYEWVPCPSCMLPEFDKTYEIKHEVGAFEHWEHKLKHDHDIKIRNNCTLTEAIEFMGSCETIVTNSYHGAYWATLLGKKVLVQPFNTKLYNMKHQPVIYSGGHWRNYIQKACFFPEALKECREANLKFYDKVKNLI